MELSKQISIDQSLPYDLLKESLEEDAKVPAKRKYFANSLAIRVTANNSYQMIYPNHLKNHVNIDSIGIDERSQSLAKLN